jgi:xylulose-5-phosphate/fructose-6-phosphate phosphoketolase
MLLSPVTIIHHYSLGLLQGYTMTGRTGIFAANESLLPLIATMMMQYSKFLRTARDTPWRNDMNSLNYISTGTWTRPEPNGLSHQNPSFIGSVLNLKSTIGRVYLPPDANTFLSTLAHCLRSKNYINLIVSSGNPGHTWLSPEEADIHCRAGGSVWKFASTDDGIDPDVVLVGLGADVMFEVIAAAAYLRKLAPSLSVRVVNITDLMVLGNEGSHPHALSHRDFDMLFTPHRDIHFNYHGYANELQGLLFGRPNIERISITSFQNDSAATTPFETVLRNGCSRYHVAESAVRGASKCNPHIAVDMQKLVAHIQHERAKVEQFILGNGVDPKGMYDVPKFSQSHGRHHPSGGQDWASHDLTYHVPKGEFDTNGKDEDEMLP